MDRTFLSMRGVPIAGAVHQRNVYDARRIARVRASRQEEMMSHACPHCSQRPLDTTSTVPYVRGFLIAFQIGTKKFIGCQPCVRSSIFKEVGLSALIGWFSITALFINPVMLVIGVVKGLTVKPDPQAVRGVFAEAGIPFESANVDILSAAYGLAAAMIAADGKVEASEVEAATRIGAQLFAGFEAGALMQRLQHPKHLPDPADLASLLARALDPQTKLGVYNYLQAIASADGEVATSEAALLQRVHANLGLTSQLHAA